MLIVVTATDGHRTIVRCLHWMRIVCRVDSRLRLRHAARMDMYDVGHSGLSGRDCRAQPVPGLRPQACEYGGRRIRHYRLHVRRDVPEGLYGPTELQRAPCHARALMHSAQYTGRSKAAVGRLPTRHAPTSVTRRCDWTG